MEKICDGCGRQVHEDEDYITERDGEYPRGLLYCPECAEENDANRYAEYCFREDAARWEYYNIPENREASDV